MNDNRNLNNAGNNYPQSGYPQSGYPQAGYPQVPLNPNEYGKRKEKSGMVKGIAIGVLALLVGGLLIQILVVLMKKPDAKADVATAAQESYQSATIITISSEGAFINGQPTDIGVYNEDGKAYLALEDIAKTAGYDYVDEDSEIKLLSQSELAFIQVGSTQVKLQDQATKATNYVEILKEPVLKDNRVYIYSRDLSVFLKNTNVSFDSADNSIKITITE